MLKYSNYEVTFAEIPDEITLCINIAGCKNNCKNCHSPWLRENTGTDLTMEELEDLIYKNQGISCVCFMGGTHNPGELNLLSYFIKTVYPTIKTALYSGDEKLNPLINTNFFNYIKDGPYIEKYGPLNNKTTNQRLYKQNNKSNYLDWDDITYKFWKEW